MNAPAAVWVNTQPGRWPPRYHDRRSCGTGLKGAARRAELPRRAARFRGLDACSFCTEEGRDRARWGERAQRRTA